MTSQALNILGLRCPHPILSLAVKAADMKSGDILEVLGDCPTLEEDVSTWCERLGKTLRAVEDAGEGTKKLEIQV
jgi:tRNA 2-thiouridine synthesizing protein A